MIVGNTKWRFMVLALLFLLFNYSSCYYSSAHADILPVPTKIATHCYAWLGPLDGPSEKNNGYRMNLGFVVGSEAILVVDTGYTLEMAAEMIAHIRKISPLPIRYAVNSNSQPHRFYGNAAFKKIGSQLISHPAELKRMDRLSGIYSSIIENILKRKKDSVVLAVLPETMIQTSKTFDLGALKVIVKTLGASHTPASLIIHVPKDKIVYTGDILYRSRLLAVLEDSNVKAWIKTYGALTQFKAHTLIPGHGQPGRLADFKFATLSYLKLLYQHMSQQVEKENSAQTAIRSLDQSAYSNLVNFKQLAGKNASWSYLEAESAAFD